MKHTQPIIALVILLILISSCVKESFSEKDLSRQIVDEGTVAVPIGYDTISFQDLLEENIASGQLSVDGQGLYWFRFSEDFINLSAQDLIQYPEFSDSYNMANNTGNMIDLTPAGTTIVLNETFYLDFGFSEGANSEEIDSIVLNDMDLEITVQLAVPANALVNVTFPGIVYNGAQYTKDLILSSTNNFSDFREYTVQLDNQTVIKNRLQLDFELTLNTTSLTIPANQNILDIEVRFSNIDFHAIYGYVGQHTINSAIEEIRMDIDNSKLSGYFNFDHTYFNLASANSFGVPFSFDLQDFIYRSYDPQDQIIDEYPLFANQSDEVAFPDISQQGETINDTTTIELDPIKLYFQDYYSTMTGSVNANANPAGNSNYNFILDSSKLILTAEYAAPFWGNTDNLSMRDEIEFNINAFFASDFEKINRLLFILNFTNHAPINSIPQVYFCNANGTRLDSLFTQSVVINGASNADSNGKVGENINAPVKIEFLADRIDKIRNTSYIIVSTRFETIGSEPPPPTSWKMFEDYFFYFHLGVAATLELGN